MKVLLLNQAFYPDVVSSAQYASDLARELVQQGHEVTVVASRRGYDNPKVEFPKQETWQGVNISRIQCSGMGKRARWRRVVDFASFLIAAAFRLVLLPKFDVVVAMTSPPLICLLGALYAQVRGARLVMWVMDLNPDQAVAAGVLHPKSRRARLLGTLLRYSLGVARYVVVLDRFMKKRILEKGVAEDRVGVIPPWSHSEAVGYDPEGRDVFRSAHGLVGKFVVMYSGNHSPCHPLDTLLEAARQLAADPRIVFCFVGGGSEFGKVKRFAADQGLENIVCLPYQPLDKLAASLSAADLHAVVMGDPFVGVIHPCKIYNVLAIGSPVLYIGPEESHIGDLMRSNHGCSIWSVRHGKVSEVAEYLVQSAEHAAELRARIPASADDFAQSRLVPRMIHALESVQLGVKPGGEQPRTEDGERPKSRKQKVEIGKVESRKAETLTS